MVTGSDTHKNRITVVRRQCEEFTNSYPVLLVLNCLILPTENMFFISKPEIKHLLLIPA